MWQPPTVAQHERDDLEEGTNIEPTKPEKNARKKK